MRRGPLIRTRLSDFITFPRACVTRHLGRNKRAGVEAQRTGVRAAAMEAAAVDGARRADFRPDRLRRDRRGLCFASAATASTGTSASGDIVLVKIDDQSLREIGRWPWPRRYHAQLIDQLTAAGAKRIFFDINFFGPAATPADDRAFADAIEALGPSDPAARARARSGRGTTPGIAGAAADVRQARASSASISVDYNYQNAVWQLPYSATVGGTDRPVLCGAACRRRADRPGRISRSIIRSTSRRSRLSPPRDVLNGTVRSRSSSRARTSSSAPTRDVIGDQYLRPRLRHGWAASTSISSAPRR